MESRRRVLKLAALISAVTLIAAAPLTTQRGAFSAATLTAHADDSYTEGKEGQLTYRKYSDHIEIFSCERSATSVEIPSAISGLPVTVIGMYAFQGTSIKSVTIPDSVTEIGSWSFNMCSGLTSVTIPDSVQKIGIRAFEYCSSLTTVEFPDHLIEISSCAFDSTPWLTEQRSKNPLVIVNGAVIDGQNCEGKVEIPSGIQYVSPSAFARNLNITSVVFPASVSKVSDNTFFYCSNLASAEFKGITDIESMAFAYCDKLTDLKLSGKLENIDSYAFIDSTATATITFYGSKEAWDRVNKSSDDQYLQRATMIFDENHSEPEDVIGDVNGDGELNVADLVTLQKWLLSVPDTELKNWKTTDLIDDEILDVFDLCMLRKAIVDKNK